jgi:hypothetical protein
MSDVGAKTPTASGGCLIWVSQKADYWEITDGLPQFEQSHDGRLS